MSGSQALEICAAAITRLTVTGNTLGQLTGAKAFFLDSSHWRWLEEIEPLFAPRKRGGAYVDPVTRAAVAASRIIADRIPSVPRDEVGCVVGTRTGNAPSVALHESARLSGKRLRPLLFAHAGWNVSVAMIAGELGCRGFTSTVCGETDLGRRVFSYVHQVLKRPRATVIVAAITDLDVLCGKEVSEGVLQASSLVCVTRIPAETQHGGFQTELPVVFPPLDCFGEGDRQLLSDLMGW